MRRIVTLLALLVTFSLPVASASALGTFVDDDGSPHEGNIEALARAGLTGGCNEAGDRYCPAQVVTRGQMAAFLVRATDTDSSSTDAFGDDDGSLFEDEINAAAAAGITGGCADGRFCPTQPVTRAQLAVFLSAAYDLAPAGHSFTDVTAGGTFSPAIGAVAAAGITLGCDDDRYCPEQAVTRGQFASFLARAEGLREIDLDNEGRGEVAFSSDFSAGDWEERFDVGLYHRDDNIVTVDAWTAEHADLDGAAGDMCSGPDETRTVQRGERSSGFDDGWIYRCEPGGDVAKSHLMTSIGDTSGYSIGAFGPDQVFEDVVEVRWAQNVNTQTLSARQWTEVKVIPVAQYDIEDVPCLLPQVPCANTPNTVRGSAGVSLSNRQPRLVSPSGGTSVSREEICLTTGQDPVEAGRGAVPASDPACSTSMIRRQMYLRDNGNGTLTYGIQQENGSYHRFTAPGSIPSGSVRVVLADHNYTPTKGSPFTGQPSSTAFTWHWDDVEVLTLP